MNAAAQLRDIDAQVFALFRKRSQLLATAPNAGPIFDLRALGVPNATDTWRLAQVQTRVWWLEISGDDVGLWDLWRYTTWLAENVRAERGLRGFGPAYLTNADIEQARLNMGIDNEKWLAIRERAAWVLR